jgi:tetratricopeptide (TPR) repeat protein
LLELLRDSGVVASAEAQSPLVLDPTSTYVVDSLALRYQRMYHSTAPAELMIPVTAHLELVDELASTAPTGPQRQQVLRNHSQVALLAGRLSFFDLHDLGTARAYYGMSLDSAREAGDPHLEAVTLGHMSFVAAATRNFRAAIDLLEGANEHASGSMIVPSWLAAVESEIRSKAGETSAALAAVERAEAALVPAKEIPTWMDYYDATRLNGFKGFAYLAAGQVDQAETALQTAIACLDAGAVKQRSVLLTDLATAYVYEGEVDKGCELASEAAVTLTRAGYETSAERLREFRQLVRPWQDRGSVKDLDERLGPRPEGNIPCNSDRNAHRPCVRSSLTSVRRSSTSRPNMGHGQTGSGCLGIPSRPCSARSSPSATTTVTPSSTSDPGSTWRSSGSAARTPASPSTSTILTSTRTYDPA